MAESVDLEMRDINRIETEDMGIQETALDYPTIPQDANQSACDLKIRKQFKLTASIDNRVYRGITLDEEGYLSYKHKRVSTKGGRGLLSINTLMKNPDTREFLEMIGYRSSHDHDAIAVKTVVENRDLETVAPEQAEAIKAKIKSFKASEQWAKDEKDKARRQLEQATNETDKTRLKEAVTYHEQIELQARQRYTKSCKINLNE